MRDNHCYRAGRVSRSDVRARRAARRGASDAARVEPVESRLMLSATVTYWPVNAAGVPGTPVTFQTGPGAAVADFGPDQVSLLQQGFSAPQYELFLNVDGITGSSTDSKHEGDIGLKSFNWGGDATRPASTGGGGGAGKSTLQELHVVAPLSDATPLLVQALATGAHHKFADLTVRRPTDHADFLTVNLDDAVVSSYEVTTAVDGTPLEEFTLNFADADVTYRPQKPDGSLDTPVTFHGEGPAQQFVPQERSILDEGFAAPNGANYFLNVTGITGESVDDKHKGQIDVQAFDWGGDALAGSTAGGGGGVGKTVFHEAHFVSVVSKASPQLLGAMASGDPIPGARFAAARALTGEFYVVTLQDVRVSSYETATRPDGRVVEEFTLNYGGFEVEYGAADSKSGALSTSFAAANVETTDFAPAQRSLLDADDAGNLGTGGTTVLLQMDGIAGESTAFKHPGSIDLKSFAWGGDATVGSFGGGGGGAGKTTLHEIHVASRMSKASPQIMQALATGQHLAHAHVYFIRSGGTQQEFLRVDMTDAVVGSYRLSTGPDGTPLEEYTLDFAGADLTYTPVSGNGVPQSPVAFHETGLEVQHFSPPQPSMLDEGYALPTTDRYFLALDGIPGESTDAKHPNQLDVLGIQWGGEAVGSAATGGGGGTGMTQFQEVHFVSQVSKASPLLMHAMATGDHLAHATLTGIHSGVTQSKFLDATFADAVVSSYQVVMGQHGRLVEEFTLNFPDVDLTYTTTDSKTGAGDTTSFSAHAVDVVDFSPTQHSLLQDGFEGAGTDAAFLSIDGVAGSSTDSKHKGDIQVLSFSWGGDATEVSAGGGGAGTGNATLEELHVVSRLSAASPKLLEMMDGGAHSPGANLVVRSGGATPVDFYKLALDDVMVSSYQLSTAADGSPTEEITLSFDASHLQYLPQLSDGRVAEPVTFDETDLSVDDFAPAQRSVLQSSPDVTPAGYHMLLQLDGVPGESTDAKVKGAIDVLAFEWGGDATVSTAAGGGAGAGKTVFHELHFVSHVSKASPTLLSKMTSGVHLPGGVLTLIQNTTGAAFLKVSLADVQVSSYQVTTAVDGSLTEEFTLSFGPGGAVGTPVADAGGPYSVNDLQSVTLDASGSTDPDQDPATLDYAWDLDGDGVFGETGADAARGDEVGIHPIFSAAGMYGPQTLNITLRVTDDTGKSDTDVTTVTIVDVTPPETTITSQPPALTNQTSATIAFTGTDQGTPADQLTFSAEIDGGPRVAVTSPLTLSGLADGVHTVKVFAKDLAGNEDPTPAVATWKVDTVGPAALNLAANPSPASNAQPVTLTATISDVATGNSPVASAQYSLDGGTTWLPMAASDGAFDSPSEAVTVTFGPLPAGVYTLKVRGADAAGNTGPASTLTLPVFNPADFVTGGGFIQSPAGAAPGNPALAGKATIDLNVAYRNGSNDPAGSVSLRLGAFNFASTDIDWLVVVGNTATIAGAGTVNGAGSYSFEAWMTDGNPGKGAGGDTFRLRITDNATGAVVYDSGTDAVQGGNLKVHS